MERLCSEEVELSKIPFRYNCQYSKKNKFTYTDSESKHSINQT